MNAAHHLDKWYEDNKELFYPPVCNKLMHKEQLSVMFVGGPNTRTDFHLEQGSEFFFMYRGRMELPIIERGERKVIKIEEGEVFLLPSRIPHSPQRPMEGSLGLVIERERYKNEGEVDGLRWYTDFETCKDILWERYFHCGDLGKDLVPVVQAYKSSQECKTGVPTGENIVADPPLKQDVETVVPRPFNLYEWIEKNKDTLENGGSLNLFGQEHPDKEFTVMIVGGESEQTTTWRHDTWLFQIKGSATVSMEGKEDHVLKKSAAVLSYLTPTTKFPGQRVQLVLLLQITRKGTNERKHIRNITYE